jgi:hypothetical protein
LISISFCTFLSVTFTISLKVTDKSVQKEIDINTEALWIVNSEIVKVTDDSVQKEIDINTEVLGIVNGEINTSVLISISFCTFSYVTFTISPSNP